MNKKTGFSKNVKACLINVEISCRAHNCKTKFLVLSTERFAFAISLFVGMKLSAPGYLVVK